MDIILKANKVNLFVSSVLFVFWYHSLKFLDTPRISFGITTLTAGSSSYASDTWFKFSKVGNPKKSRNMN
jgi:hypothetical protein